MGLGWAFSFSIISHELHCVPHFLRVRVKPNVIVAAEFADTLDLSSWDSFCPANEAEGMRTNHLKLVKLPREAIFNCPHIKPRVVETLTHGLEFVDLRWRKAPSFAGSFKLCAGLDSLLTVHLANLFSAVGSESHLPRVP